jgi:hypothetical protein
MMAKHGYEELVLNSSTNFLIKRMKRKRKMQIVIDLTKLN